MKAILPERVAIWRSFRQDDGVEERATCSECDRPVKCKGLCGTHYERFRKGKPLKGPVRKYTQQDLDLLASGQRRCSGACGEIKPLDQFYKTKAVCKVCAVAERTAYKQANPEANRASVARYRLLYPERVKRQKEDWYNRDPAARRAHRLLTTYGLTIEAFNELLASQGGRCAICRTDEPDGKNGVWQVDHCHDSRQIRGILCDACNRGIGMLRHDVAVLAAAIAYLAKGAP